MSFSRAPLKRFNEYVGCAPAPGSYEVKPGEMKGAASFNKSDRFRPVKPGAPLPPPSPSRSLFLTPVRRTFSVDGLDDGLSAKKKNGMTLEKKQQKHLEKEIRFLVQQRGEQDRRLLALEEELKKVEAKLLVAVREKTGLAANVTALERQRAELMKINELLKSKDLRLKRQDTVQEKTISGSQLDTVKLLESELEQCATDLKSTQCALRQKEEEALTLHQELQASKDALLETEMRLENQKQELKSSQEAVIDLEKQINVTRQHVHDSRATVCQQEAELARLREVLRRTEKELDERVAHLEQRYLFSEEERCKTQEEGLRRVQELKTELSLLKETKRDEKKRQLWLQQEHAALTEELTKEKALVDSLSVLVKQEREESAEQLTKLTEEMEEVLGELAMLEDQDQKRQEMLWKSQEVVQKLQEEHDELERQLRESRAQLESSRDALNAADKRQKELEQVVERVTQQMREEADKVIHQKEEEIKRMQGVLEEHQLAEAEARDENARILLEVQTHLAQRGEELNAMEMSHTALMSQLQQEIETQRKEKEEALVQLEEQRGVQEEKEQAQKMLEEARLGKEKIMEQLKQEREERVRIERELVEVRATLETERKDLKQVKSDISRLNAEFNRVDEEKKSQVELVDQSRLALENQLIQAEEERNELQTRLNQAEQEGVNLQTQMDVMEETMQALQQQVDNQQQDKRALQKQVEILTQEKVTLQWEMAEQQQELQRQIADTHEKSTSSSETEHWRQQYEELFAKVKPFQEQLNAFAAEKNALLSENGANQEELNKLADSYARLLGHQNQKQKIKHVMKLKDENIALKQEVSKLRSQVNRQKSDLEQLKSKLPGVPHRRFDPSKAFQHNKENRRAEATQPLREGNHYA